MHVTYINEVKEGRSYWFLGQMHVEVFMRSTRRCTRLFTFWLIIRLIKCKCFNEVVREMFLFFFGCVTYISVQPNVKEKDY